MAVPDQLDEDLKDPQPDAMDFDDFPEAAELVDEAPQGQDLMEDEAAGVRASQDDPMTPPPDAEVG